MPKTINETTTRWCCQPCDRKAVKLERVTRCKFCGQYFKLRVYTDAAGSRDTEFVPCSVEEARQEAIKEIGQ